MIELLLEAERALSYGLVDRAEQLYHQVADADPRNSIAVVGLARVALERADDLGSYRLARRALAIDPENEAARRLAIRLEEVLATRGEPIADPMPRGWASTGAGDRRAEVRVDSSRMAAGAVPPIESVANVDEPPAVPDRATDRRSPLDRLLRRNR